MNDNNLEASEERDNKILSAMATCNDPATVEVLNLLMWHSLVFGCECDNCRADTNNREIISNDVNLFSANLFSVNVFSVNNCT